MERGWRGGGGISEGWVAVGVRVAVTSCRWSVSGSRGGWEAEGTGGTESAVASPDWTDTFLNPRERQSAGEASKSRARRERPLAHNK